MIPYGRQDISKDDIESVIRVLKSDYLTQGPVLPEFERRVKNYCGSAHAFAVNNATSALHIACAAMDVGEGDIVWTSPITFVATANCAIYCRAKVDFVDVDQRTNNMCVDALKEKLDQSEKDDTLPKVVIPVHLSGQSCDMETIHKLSKKYGFGIIEDASHAIGGKYLNEPVGNCRYSDITVFSFHPVKIITTGEGGMCLANSPKLAEKLHRLRSHGITRTPIEMKNPSDGPWYYEQIELGFNYRLTDIQAALGLSQMDRLDAFVARRHEIANHYDQLLDGVDIETPHRYKKSHSSFHLYIIKVKDPKDHLPMFEKLRKGGILVNLHYIPVYRQPYYQRMGFKIENFPNAERYYAQAISIPMYSSMTELQQDSVVEEIKRPMGFQNLF